MTTKTNYVVKYFETDAMAIVHHSNYIRYFEIARTDFLEAIGLPYDYLENQNINCPVIGINCQYKRPCKFNDKIVVETKLKSFKGVRVAFEYVITCKDQVVCTGESQHTFVDENMKVININKTNKDLVEKLNKALTKTA